MKKEKIKFLVASLLLKQIAVGLLLGFVLIGLLSIFIPDNKTASLEMFSLDEEIIAIPSLKQNEREQAEIGTDSQASLYPFFSDFRMRLNREQAKAIEDGKPTLSIIIPNVGLREKLNNEIINKLPDAVTLGLSPYLRNHNKVASMFHDYGFETWLTLAAMTDRLNHDHGKNALNPTLDFKGNIALLSAQMDDKDKLTGVILPEGSLIIQNPDLWGELVYDLHAQGYGVFDNTQRIIKPALFFHDEKKAPYIKGDITLETNLTADEMKQALANIRKSVMEERQIIATIALNTVTSVQILSQWIETLAQDGIMLVPLSAQAKL